MRFTSMQELEKKGKMYFDKDLEEKKTKKIQR